MINKKSVWRMWPIVLLLQVAASLSVGAEGADEIIDKVEKAFGQMSAMTASFTQTVESKGFGETIKNHGKMAMLKPLKMRWEYDEPKGRLVVIDGERFWLYDPEDNLVRFEDLKGFLGPNSPALFLAGDGILRNLFKIDLVKPSKKVKMNTVSLRLVPKKPQPGVKAMLLTVESVSFKIVELLIVDHIGNKNRMRFSDVSVTARPEASLFKFTPPVGVPVRAMSQLP